VPASPVRFSGERGIKPSSASGASARLPGRVPIAGGRLGQLATAQASKATQRAGIVSVGRRRDRYGFNSRYLRRME
jgi:hypothetical protein